MVLSVTAALEILGSIPRSSKVFLGIFDIAARSFDLCPVNGNRLAYMGPKRTGELLVYIGTPLPNPSGNTGVMVCVIIISKLVFEK